MTGERQPILVGFDNAGATNALLGHLGLNPDLGAFLSGHLLSVLRRQYSDLAIESIEFLGADNCMADGSATTTPNIIAIETLCMPVDVNVIVAARNERYSLQLHVILKAQQVEGAFDIKSDVMVRDQRFLGVA